MCVNFSLSFVPCLGSDPEVTIKKDIDYLVLPELAIPRNWAVLFAQRLLTRKISLITGVEYLYEDNKLRNSIYHFLISDDIGFNHLKLIV